MKLGNLVTFERHYVRAGDSFDPEFIELLVGETQQDYYDNGYLLKKLKMKKLKRQAEGIVVGVRYLATGTRFDYIEDAGPAYGPGSGEWRWHSTPQPREKFYLVACNLNTIRKVKPEDLKLKMVEDPIEGLMDE